MILLVDRPTLAEGDVNTGEFCTARWTTPVHTCTVYTTYSCEETEKKKGQAQSRCHCSLHLPVSKLRPEFAFSILEIPERRFSSPAIFDRNAFPIPLSSSRLPWQQSLPTNTITRKKVSPLFVPQYRLDLVNCVLRLPSS